MPPRNKVFDLPPEIRDALNERLVSTGFQGYEALAAWLNEQGHEISKSSVHRYGKDLQEEFEDAMGSVRRTTEMAKAMADAVEDEEGHLIDATARMVQEHLLRISLEFRKMEMEPDAAAHHLGKVSKALDSLGRLSITQKKYAQALRKDVAREAADAAEGAMASQGMSREAIDSIKRDILGIA
ncbi:DUF3486 family protein [Halomonas sp. SSL-5]|uniref:DUF3486 family protein n=1 Tax=Halomonas sp. SSL-5 TaxID=3065855 RepID=UPI00273A4CF0|nr:DUF3486 family protein [Halomonas sp. SSL-5]MDY7117140.1 DUF3486 family protein [Halomonas sp. SSL-5]